MMGRQSGCHNRLFYSFNLEDLVPTAHPLRGIDRFLNLSDLRRHLASFLLIAQPKLSPLRRWWIESSNAFNSPRNGSSAIPPVGRRRCWRGWSSTKVSNPMCPCGKGGNATTRRCPAANFSGTRTSTNTDARKDTPCAASGGRSRTRVLTSPRPTQSSIGPVSLTAQRAP